MKKNARAHHNGKYTTENTSSRKKRGTTGKIRRNKGNNPKNKKTNKQNKITNKAGNFFTTSLNYRRYTHGSKWLASLFISIGRPHGSHKQYTHK